MNAIRTGLSPAYGVEDVAQGEHHYAPAGDVVLFKRDADCANETLVPAGEVERLRNLIKFDAYGSGRAPRFSGLYHD